ncbi:OmpH family outer membrane protein [Abyssalbus ytuae]|uniref:OmpH family outer membrane protein n=1 Tax=Abyssalbus ytuae TaxID=2926907 RepID=A0A9E6ZQ46_9FLAO|nr:OmpH family outer membrane protein [Abyssalbus ytuae]UOB18874.1 OmpH family outer membrane protein [Abyssalbus ytuae]
MKVKVLLLLLSLVALKSFSQKSVRIGYIDMEYILQNVDEYRDANKQLETKVQKWKTEIETQKGSIEQMKKDLSAEKILLTPELIEEREEDIKAMEESMIEYQQDRFGPQGDLVMQKKMLIQPIQDQVFNAVQDIAQNRRYDFIFDKSADIVMLYSDKRHDISDLVLRVINKTRKTSKLNNNSESAQDIIEDEMDPDLEERKKLQEEKREERLKQIEENREAKLKELEERKKAYEERRKKLLEQREAAKKAKEEEKDKNNEDKKEEEQKLN